jgi:hypothetical protein
LCAKFTEEAVSGPKQFCLFVPTFLSLLML